jgi:F-type H+-transporting ATPase subunit delta
MAKKANARRYARAVFEIALENKALDRWQADLQNLAGALSTTELREALESPKISFEDKSKLMEKLVNIDPLALNLVRLLIVKHAAGIMGEIAAEYTRLLNAYRGIQKAKVVTAVEIDEIEKTRMEQTLGALVGAKIMLEPEVDPGILGGVIARIDGKLLDGSTRTRLEVLKRKMAGEGR